MPDKMDDVANDLDDLMGDVEALKDDPASDVDQVERVERALEKAQQAVDDILTTTIPRRTPAVKPRGPIGQPGFRQSTRHRHEPTPAPR